MSHPIVTEAQAKMKKAVDHTLHEFSAIHTGKATPTMVENVMVEAYGSMMRLKECAAITTPDARLIQIQPWDVGLGKAIAKAVIDANLGFNPIVDGKIIRVPLPEMSRERRQEFVKTANKLAEEGRNQVRAARRDANDKLKKMLKDKTVSEDAERDGLDQIQKLTDLHIGKIDELSKSKEHEIMSV